jgi:hypothetical protein
VYTDYDSIDIPMDPQIDRLIRGEKECELQRFRERTVPVLIRILTICSSKNCRSPFIEQIPRLLGSPHWFAPARQRRSEEVLMPVKIASFEPLSEEEFTALRQQKARKTDPAMVAFLAEVGAGRPVRVPLVQGQSARGLRTAISRAATSRGLTVEMVEGDGFVAVRKTDEPRTRKGNRRLQKGSDGGADHPSGKSKMRPRSSRCKIWPQGRARAARTAIGIHSFLPFPRQRREKVICHPVINRCGRANKVLWESFVLNEVLTEGQGRSGCQC